MNRQLLLAHLIEQFDSIKGEKCLQKLVYLVQEYGTDIGYNFEWNKYGPVSYILSSDIQEIEALGFISIQFEDKIPIYQSANIEKTVTSYWYDKYQVNKLPEKTKQAIHRIQEVLDDKIGDPLHLELVASIDYLNRSNNNEPDLDYIGTPKSKISPNAIEQARSTLSHFNT